MDKAKKSDAQPGGQWSGVITNVRISQTADPELYRELARSNHRERSRRLRSLALLGLYAATRCDLPAAMNEHPHQGQGAEQGEGGQDDALKRITRRMLGSLSA